MIPVDGWRKKSKFTNPCAHASLSNKLYVYILCKKDCIDMQLEKTACKQVLQANTERASFMIILYVRTYDHSWMPLSMLRINCSG